MTQKTNPALPATADSDAPPPPSPAPGLLTSAQLMAALGIHRRMLKNWNRDGIIPSIGVRHARRYDLEQVMEALRTHGRPQPDSADCTASASPPGQALQPG